MEPKFPRFLEPLQLKLIIYSSVSPRYPEQLRMILGNLRGCYQIRYHKNFQIEFIIAAELLILSMFILDCKY